MAKVGVILSGCGVMDGAEIHESVLTLLALDRAGAEAVCMAPNVDQYHVVNHVTNEAMKGERRNVLVESARIARGKIRDLKDVKANEIDALILPGGYGAAKNLSTFAITGDACSVNPEVQRLVREVHAAGKPIGAICIAPAVMAKVFGQEHVELTVGNDPDTAKALTKMGAKHIERTVREIHVDRKQKVVSTPAYMLAQSVKEAAEGIERLVKAVLEMVKQ